VLSGGDPFLPDDEKLQSILQEIYSIFHIAIIRIHTRVPCTLKTFDGKVVDYPVPVNKAKQ